MNFFVAATYCFACASCNTGSLKWAHISCACLSDPGRTFCGKTLMDPAPGITEKYFDRDIGYRHPNFMTSIQFGIKWHGNTSYLLLLNTFHKWLPSSFRFLMASSNSFEFSKRSKLPKTFQLENRILITLAEFVFNERLLNYYKLHYNFTGTFVLFDYS